MSQKLPVNEFKWVEDIFEFNGDFMKGYSDESDEWYFLKADFEYSGSFHNFHNDLRFFPQRMKIEKVEKLVANLHGRDEYVIHIRILK